jgi:hypothetical protein
MKLPAIVCLCGGALAAVSCADGPAVPTSPSAIAAAPDSAATVGGSEGTARAAVAASLPAAPRSGDLHVTKECSGFTGGAGSFCTIKSSNVQAIEVESRIIYLQPDQIGTPQGSDIVLDPPGPGNNKAFGHCSLASGVCTFSGGTGKFTGFRASVAVTANEDFSLWFWEGTYSFRPQD